jgi:peptidyl-tRNA hydrolase ICT1
VTRRTRVAVTLRTDSLRRHIIVASASELSMLARAARALGAAPRSCALLRYRALSTVGASPPPPPEPARSPPHYFVADGATSVELPREKLTVSFSRSSGAGGQNVNKVSTKAEVRFALGDASWLAPSVRARVAALFPGAVSAAGDVFVSSQRHRTQEANLADALAKLTSMVTRAAAVPKVRATRTALSELTKASYRDDKRARSAIKSARRGPSFDD